MLIELVNHACVKIKLSAGALLCDPWLSGSAFNDGWELLVPTPLEASSILAGVGYIWLSHEHPDHFSPRFLDAIAPKQAAAITVMHHERASRGLKEYLRQRHFRTLEMAEDRPYRLPGGIIAVCGSVGWYDHWLYLCDGNRSLLNLNDCALTDRQAARRLAAWTGVPDLLLSQFSYAAWPGPRTDRAARLRAADYKLAGLAAQIAGIRPAFVIPFASLVYFAHEENGHLNDCINSPRRAAQTIAGAGATPVVLYPGQRWEVGVAHDNRAALQAYDEVYGRRLELPLHRPAQSVSLTELARSAEDYRARLLARNSARAMRWVGKLPLLEALSPLRVRLHDLKDDVMVSPLHGLQPVATGPAPDVTMHSSSLAYLLAHDFGYDTLLVNGRFDADWRGFARMAKSLGLDVLNASGWQLGAASLMHPGGLAALWRGLKALRPGAAALTT
jgi:UDP-MurNAc hydroxylase